MIAVGAEVPLLIKTPTAVDLFQFSAAAWLIHRIHYDVPFTTEHEGHPGLLIHGPLQGTYMLQSVQWWLGIGVRPTRVAYRHSAPAYLGDTLSCGGTVTSVSDHAIEVDLWVTKADGTVTTSGQAAFSLPPSD